jgi:hypothetical protein
MLVLALWLATGRADAASGSDSTALDLSTILLGDQDLPTGYERYAPLTGPLDAERLRAFGVDPSQMPQPGAVGFARTWTSPSTGQGVMAWVLDVGHKSNAEKVVRGSVKEVLKLGAKEFGVPNVPKARGHVLVRDNNGVVEELRLIAFQRGSLFFLIRTSAPVEISAANERLALDLAAKQWAAAPADVPETAPDDAGLQGQAVGTVTGVLVTYFAALGGVARLKDPLRRRRRRRASEHSAIGYPTDVVVDVSADARHRRRQATWRLVLQLAGVALAAPAAVPSLWPQSLVYLPVALLVGWLPTRFMPAPHSGSPLGRRIFTGRHPVRVTILFAVATVLLLFGLLLLVAAIVQAIQPPSVADVAGSNQTARSAATAWAGIAFVAGGLLCYRRARRAGALAARELMRRDSRPIVLFLRSFRDDRLRLRIGGRGRRSAIEALSPRRSDLFEELLAGHLSIVGPVVALNPPGKAMASLGAARETLPAEAWQPAIADWMRQSALIVIVAPPGDVTPGLVWELQTLSAQRLWSKTLIVAPPVPDQTLQLRWQALTYALPGLGPFAVPLPTDPADILTLTAPDARWHVVTANRRTEWSYASALAESLRRLLPIAGPAQPHKAHASMDVGIRAPKE